VVVMRDGRFVTKAPTSTLSRHQMANLMVGRELSDLFPPKLPPKLPSNLPLKPAPTRVPGVAPGTPGAVTPTGHQPAPALKVQGLNVPGFARDVSFEVHPGEILGFAGLVGAGRTESFEGLLGLRTADAERVEIGGRAVRIRSPREAADLGLTYLSEDRKGKGLHLSFGMTENLTLMDLARYARPWLRRGAERAALKKAVGDFGIRTGSLTLRASSLSGGNQQKLALAKVLHPAPRVVILDEPTRGVDVGAKRDIYFLVQKLAAAGCAVVVISSELLELIGLCHRVAVMRAGRLQVTLAADQLSEETLIAHATGTH
jgi:ribose transport system ATP-binding protein